MQTIMLIHIILPYILLLKLTAASINNTTIRSNFDPSIPHWRDTTGNRIEAHAGGIFFDTNDQNYYWYGESKKTVDLSTHGVNCYRSKSLAGAWEFMGEVFSQQDIRLPSILKHTYPGPYVIERPKVLYNRLTQKYVMWFHLDVKKYSFRHAGVATSLSATGPFLFAYALQPDNIPSLDMNVWMDPFDNKAYLIRSCDNKYAGISGMTEDYMNTTGLISTHDKFEGMALFRTKDGTTYLISSHLTGWNPNPLMLFRNDGSSMQHAKWTLIGNPTNDATSFNTQPTYVISQEDENGKEYFVYLSDNWVKDGGLLNAGYIWLPFWFAQDGTILLKKQYSWNLATPFATKNEEIQLKFVFK